MLLCEVEFATLRRLVGAVAAHPRVLKRFLETVESSEGRIVRGDVSATADLMQLANELPFDARNEAIEAIRGIEATALQGKEDAQLRLSDAPIDVAIICALRDPEFRWLKEWFDVGPVEIAESAQASHALFRGRFFASREVENGSRKRGKRYIEVIAAHQQEMGICECAVLATKVIMRWKPRYLIMTGVCGGNALAGVRLGDILVASSVYTYQSGKYTEQGFVRETRVVNIERQVLRHAEDAMMLDVARLYDRWGGERIWSPSVRIGPFACGDAVVDEAGKLEDIAKFNRKTIGVDMESYAVARAVELLPEFQSSACIVKGVMDLTVNKSDSAAREFAAYASAAFVHHLCTRHLCGSEPQA